MAEIIIVLLLSIWLLGLLIFPWFSALVGYFQRKMPAEKRFKNSIAEAKREFRGECLTSWIIIELTILFGGILVYLFTAPMEIKFSIYHFLLTPLAVLPACLCTYKIRYLLYIPKTEEELIELHGKIVDWKYQAFNSGHGKSYFPIFEFKYTDGKTYYVKGTGRDGEYSFVENGIEHIFVGKTTGKLYFGNYNHEEKREFWEVMIHEFFKPTEEE